MNAKVAAYFLSKLADLTALGGRVPTEALATLIAKLEGQDRTAARTPKAAATFRALAHEMATQQNPSRVKLAGVLRRILADTLEVSSSRTASISLEEQLQRIKGKAPRKSKDGDLFVIEIFSPFVNKYIATMGVKDESVADKELGEQDSEHKRIVKVLEQAVAKGEKTASSEEARILAELRA